MAAPYRACVRSRSRQLSVHKTVDAVDRARSPQRNEIDFLRISRFEPYCSAGWNVQPHTIGRAPIEIQSAVHLEEMAMRTHLNGPIAAIRHSDARRGSAVVSLQRFAPEEVFARDHLRSAQVFKRIGSWTVTSFVPSGNVPST